MQYSAPSAFSPPSPATRHPHSPLWLAVPALLLAALLAWHGPIPQWPDYHHFADTRRWLGIPNAADVLSNLAFAWAGGWGWLALAKQMPCRNEAVQDASLSAWRLFAMAVVCTAAGSSAYHWAPDNLSLVFDRLPIAWACAVLLCAFMAERVDPRWAGRTALTTAVSAASLAVGWWAVTEQHGAGDLRPYLAVQFLPLAIIPLGLALRLPTRTARAVPAWTWGLALGLYAAAKGFEVFDRHVLDGLQLLSGHTLKHLAAALAAACLLNRAARARA